MAQHELLVDDILMQQTVRIAPLDRRRRSFDQAGDPVFQRRVSISFTAHVPLIDIAGFRAGGDSHLFSACMERSTDKSATRQQLYRVTDPHLVEPTSGRRCSITRR